MKLKFLAMAALAIILALGAYSQDQGGEGETSSEELNLRMDQIDLKPEEVKRIEAILRRDQEGVVKAKAEIKVLQARLSRLLLERDSGNPEIAAAVKASLDQEYIIRMSMIRNQLEIMELLGNERWAKLYRLAKSVPEAERVGKAIPVNSGGKAAERNRSLLRLLKQSF
jgi:hypothetical protein